MKNIKILILIFLINIIPACSYMVQTKKINTEYNVAGNSNLDKSSPKCTFSFPISWALNKNERVNLFIEIPAEFKCLQDLYSFPKVMQFTLEPINQDNPFTGREFITIIKRNQEISSEKSLALYKKENKITNILEEYTQDHGKYSLSGIISKYITHQNLVVIIGAKFFCGPIDSVEYSYVIRINEKMTEKDALKKLKEFEKNNTRIIINSLN